MPTLIVSIGQLQQIFMAPMKRPTRTRINLPEGDDLAAVPTHHTAGAVTVADATTAVLLGRSATDTRNLPDLNDGDASLRQLRRALNGADTGDELRQTGSVRTAADSPTH